MGGLIILPRKEDFDTITPLQATSILKEVTLAPEDVEKVLSQLKK